MIILRMCSGSSWYRWASLLLCQEISEIIPSSLLFKKYFSLRLSLEGRLAWLDLPISKTLVIVSLKTELLNLIDISLLYIKALNITSDIYISGASNRR